MNFGFDEEQKNLGDTVEQLLRDFSGLTAPDLDPGQSEGAWEALAELGLFALLVPERFGGVGLAIVDIALAVEALGNGLAPPIVASTLAATDAIVRYGSDAQQGAWLPRIAAGELRIAIAALEADSSYDPRGARAAISDGVLDGRKVLVAGAQEADLIIVLAVADGRPRLGVVERGDAGVAVRAHDSLDPTAGLCEVTFSGVSVGADQQLGASTPEHAVDRLLDCSATLYAGMQMGIAARMLATAVEYAKTRVQFGQPIGAFQAIKHRCADMAVAVEAGRSAAYYAFWAMTEDSEDRARAVSMAKSYCGDVGRMVCNEAIQVHGGMGFTWELGLHRFLRRNKVLEHGFGDAAYHGERILATTLALLAAEDKRQLDAA